MKEDERTQRLQAAKVVMQEHGETDSAIQAFLYYYGLLLDGAAGQISGMEIASVPHATNLERLDDMAEEGRAAVDKAVIIKLNGGLGTGMGLRKAKSLLPAKDDLTFLDIIARQVLRLRAQGASPLPVLFMNSFSTHADTLSALDRYPELKEGNGVIPQAFIQNRVPKIRQDNLHPVSWPSKPELAWCPPGHGDLYTVLAASGLLDQLLAQGLRYAFVSNADNLGAVLDYRVLGYFAAGDVPFMMEVADRTVADRKGGHVARSATKGHLLLREAAQCPEGEVDAFQDIEIFKYFNTNNLWINLPALKVALEANRGFLPLPLIRNEKTVDPADSTSPAVYQLETAMGAAIECFEGAEILRVPRTRFAPVKTTDDLLALWSDIFVLNDEFHVVQDERRTLGTIDIKLDKRFYKMLPDFRRRFPHGAPSLINCERLSIEGDVQFGRDVKVNGVVDLKVEEGEHRAIPDGARLETLRVEGR